ncbi:MAG: 5'-3' exonuclease H3TH domain-containing protein, partial [Anaerolineales bacterium]
YKATREKIPEDLRPQIERIREIVDAFNFPRLEKEGFEADDVLGTIAWGAAEKGLGVKIVTGDRDLLQLVKERVIVNLAGGKLSDAQDYYPEDVLEKFGVRPDQFVDYKALIGDTSDNIPGIKGIGPKTAAALLLKYPTLDDIYSNLSEITGRQHALLSENKDEAYLSYDLALIRTDLSIPFDLGQARTDNINLEKVVQLFRHMQFRTLTTRLQNLLGQGVLGAAGEQLTLFSEEPIKLGLPVQYDIPVEIIDSTEKLTSLSKKLEYAKQIAFDTETTSTNAMQANLVGISLAIEPGSAYYIPVGHQGSAPQASLREITRVLQPAFSNLKIPKIGHNLKYDCLVLRNHGIKVTPLNFDTMIAAWVLDPGSHNLGLKKMAELELNVTMTKISALIGTGKKQITMDAVSVKDAAAYAGADAEVPLQLQEILQPRLKKNGLLDIFESLEMPLLPVLMDMEYEGIAVDKDFFKSYAQKLNKRIVEIQKEVYRLVGHDFNLNSTQQLSD